ncbi:MAG: ribosomal-protein-alanine N-acetyltransferase [Acidobacteria bacterium]|nr:ribosomal-protein-alanine N-acetyltransferase [Acidobacteriota bacterium]
MRGAVLALEGALHPAGVALVLDGQVLEAPPFDAGRGVRPDLVGAARDLLSRHGLAAAELAGLAVGIGPGSTTGLRVALGLAQGLADAGQPLTVAFADSPRLLAEAAGLPLPAWVAIPWGRWRVMVARAREDGARPGEATLLPLAELPARTGLAGQAVAIPRGAPDLPWADGVRAVEAAADAAVALARLAAAGRLPIADRVPGPNYLLPPDAVLPTGRLASGLADAIVPLAPPDLDRLLAVERECFAEPWSRALLDDELRGGPGHVALGVAGADGSLDAAALARLAVGTLEIQSVAVRPRARGRGLGRALVRALLERARAARAERADLEVRAGNAAAIALYASEGFVPVGRRRRYYGDGEDALLMSLILGRYNEEGG